MKVDCLPPVFEELIMLAWRLWGTSFAEMTVTVFGVLNLTFVNFKNISAVFDLSPIPRF